jgi:hypothetical protein
VTPAEDIFIDPAVAILARDAVVTGNLTVLADVLAQMGDDAAGYRYKSVDGAGRGSSSAHAMYGGVPRAGKPLVLHGYQSGYTLLHFAAQYNAHEAIRLVVAAAANARVHVDVVDDAGRTPLFVAARNGSVTAAAALLRNGANPRPARPDGWTAMHAAAANGHAGCVAALVEGSKG